MSEKLSVVLAGAGTAGHINTLISIAEQIKILCPQARITAVGAQGGMEETLVPASGLPLRTIPKLAFPRSLSPSAALFPAKWAKEVRDAEKILRSVDADCVAGVGGYVSAPCYRAAKKLKIPIAIHEQNAMAGIANRLGARWADYIGTAYGGVKLRGRGRKPAERIGLPLKAEVIEAAKARREDPEGARAGAIEALGLKPNLPVLLVTGGSLGALSINKAVAGASRELLQVCQVVHVCGKGKSEIVAELVTQLAGKDALGELSVSQDGQYFAQEGNYRIVDYFPHMSLLYKAASLAICRSGAGTVNEMEAMGMPAVYVPLPIGNGEQRFNAKPVVDNGGGILVQDSRFTEGFVKKYIPPLITDKKKLEAMGEKARELSGENAALVMAEEILQLANYHKYHE